LIIKSRAVGSVSHWSQYLRQQGDNEKVTEHEIGATSQDLKEALEEWREAAQHTRSEGNFMYHVSFNPKADENLTPEQWMKAIDLVEERMGFQGHQRVVYEHVKNGRQHFHVLWNRVDPETGTIRDIKGDRYTLRRIANELEREYGLTPTKPVRDFDDQRGHEEWERKSGDRARIDPQQMKAELTALWQATDSGKAFIAAAEDRGYRIAKGDRRDFVILDHTGEAHSLARRMEGVKAADVRDRFKDVDRQSLPSAAEARVSQREQFRDREGDFDREAAIAAWARGSGKEGARAEEMVFDRDAQDRDWQAALADGAITHDEAQRTSLREGWEALKAAHGKDLKPEVHEQTEDAIFGGPNPKTFRETWDGVVADEKEQRGLEHAQPTPSSAKLNTGRSDAVNGADALNVMNGPADAIVGLGEFIIVFFAGSPPARPMSREERSRSERRSERALDNMKRSLDQNEPFNGHDIAGLTHHHLLQIREKGDPYLRDLLARRDRERQRYLGNERER
jgi:hypothetical protein